MEAFKKLIEIARKLNSPGGCPWDLKQTFKTLQPFIVEESHELLEAVDKEDDAETVEELADLLYVVIFYCMVAEREGRFTLDEVCNYESEKLVRRHPHVFGETVTEDPDEISRQWEKIKKEEKGKKERESVLDGIPKGLDLLARGQKVISKICRHDLDHLLQEKELDEVTEEGIGENLVRLVYLGHKHGFDVAGSMRRALQGYEKAFRAWEGRNKSCTDPAAEKS